MYANLRIKHTQKTQSRHNANYVVTGGNGNCYTKDDRVDIMTTFSFQLTMLHCDSEY